ncbi:cytochrome P450 4c3-like [Diorhabda sublineata]|uniref:cytochrome P450 4c3-like n=1 Tax=Diorhabda sublineata TaxID=1163346 RepID=UPI0024E12F8E|nr:cytochrome P450 4c3-like [Diorhabda sublineata]
MLVLIVSLSFLFILFILLIIIPILHRNFVKRQSKYLWNVPGPKPNPYYGNLGAFIGKSPDEYLQEIASTFEEYGDLVKVYKGPLQTILLVGNEKFVEFLLSSSKLIDKSDEYDNLKMWLGNGLLTSTGTKWKQRRRLITPAFHFSILENFVDVFESASDIFIKTLATQAEKKSFDIYPLVSLLTLDIISETAMGISINAQINNQSEYRAAVKEMCSLIHSKNYSIVATIGSYLYPFTSNYYKEINTLEKLHSHTISVIRKKMEERKESDDSEEDDDIGIKKRVAFLDLLLKCTVNGQNLSVEDIREEVDTFMFEGHDTTSSAISLTLYALANNPAAQEKALDEQKIIFGNLATARPKIGDLQNMKYLEMVIKETLRLYSSVPFFGRTASEEFEWNNIIVPKGQQIVIFPYIIHRNPKNFPEPLKFIPERFETIDGTRPYTYIPFSAGPRNCIGQKFAMLEMKSTVSKVLRNYELLPAKNHRLKLAPELILVSKSGIHLSVKKRE